MFQNLKVKNHRKSKWKNMANANNFHLSPSASSGSVKGNEADRMVNCRICGFPCDKERDAKSNYNSFAGFGINQGAQLTAGASIGDKRVPAAGSVSTSPDQYYNRQVVAGCPACGSLVYWT